ncbi:MAG: pilus assembly protein N-terminal domain-containing protein [Bryobacteraceae bacterium]|nr:pilus assembly protein N-terminal domain-containing protein [Bryobacteraceae bacterium]
MNLRIGPAILSIAVSVTVTLAMLAQQPAAKLSAGALQAEASQPRHLVVTVGKSLVLDSPADIQRVSIVSEDYLEVVAISPRELVLNGKGAGETSLILWQTGGGRLMFDVSVQPPPAKPVKDEKLAALVAGLKSEIYKELGDQDISVSYENKAVFLRGTVKDLVSAQRATAIAEMFGKPVNLLRVATPGGAAQILLKVKFADVDRTVASDLGMNLLSTGAGNTVGRVTTGQYSPPTVSASSGGGATSSSFSLSDALNVFLFRPDLNLGATIKALQNQQVIQILAEPNLLTSDGKKASFLSGGEFPYPVVQSSAGGGLPTISIMFKEFGIRLDFTPTVTPRGTIDLVVTPEVSSLDYANGLVYQGFNIPALAERKMSTEVELKDGQSFAIAGLLDNRVTENLNKMPGLASIPLFGRLFQSRSQNRTKSELLVVVTPEIVRPIPEGQPRPEIVMPKEFMQKGATTAPRTPGMESTGAEPVKPMLPSVPLEQLLPPQTGQGKSAAPAPTYQLVPVAPPSAPAEEPPAATPPAPPSTSPTHGQGGSGL